MAIALLIPLAYEERLYGNSLLSDIRGNLYQLYD